MIQELNKGMIQVQMDQPPRYITKHGGTEDGARVLSLSPSSLLPPLLLYG
jgi:hypothetical protein